MADSDEELPPNILELPHPKYRRKEWVNMYASPNSCYRVKILEEVRKTLIKFGGNKLLDIFKDGPFGHLVEWNPGYVYSQTLHGILTRAVYSERGIWFYMKGQYIEYTVQDHALVTGLRFGQTSFNPCTPRIPGDSKLCLVLCGGKPETASWLLTMFKELPSRVHDPTGDIMIKLANLLIANVFVLGHNPQKAPFPWLWELVDNMQWWTDFPWGAYSYKMLRYYIREAKFRDKYHFPGPVWAFVVWAFEAVGDLGMVAGTRHDQMSYPRCLRWSFLMKVRIEDEALYELFMVEEHGQLINNLHPDTREEEMRYFTSTQSELALDVRFRRHTTPIGTPEYFPYRAPQCRRLALEGDNGEGLRNGMTCQTNAVATDVCEQSLFSKGRSKRVRDNGKRRRESSYNCGDIDGDGGYAISEQVIGTIGEVVTAKHSQMIIELRGEIKESETRVINQIKEMMKELKGYTGERLHEGTRENDTRMLDSDINASHHPVNLATGGCTSLKRSEPMYEHVGPHMDSSLPAYTTSNHMYDSGHRWIPMRSPQTVVLDHKIPERAFSKSVLGFCTPDVALPSTHRAVTIRELARVSPSVAKPCGSTSLSASSACHVSKNATEVHAYQPSPPRQECRNNDAQCLEDGRDRRIYLLQDAIKPVFIRDLKRMTDIGTDWDFMLFDLALMVLRKKLARGEGVLPAYRGGGAVICNCHVMLLLKREYERLMAEASANNYRETEEVKNYIKAFCHLDVELLRLPKNDQVSYLTTDWWNATSVIFPWYVQNRFIVVVLKMRSRVIHVIDPAYENLDEEGKGAVRQQLSPLKKLLPFWLQDSSFWIMNQRVVKAPHEDEAEFRLYFCPKESIIKSGHPNCSGAVACMNIERYVSRCPSVGWSEADCCSYKQMHACKVFINAA